jgi:bacillithiol system protein YtxJ
MFFKKNSFQNIKNNWNQLNDIAQIDEIVALSYQQKIIIFKHSTRCSISIMALKSFEKSFDFNNENYKTYYLDLLSYRNISNEITNIFKVTHHSPQILLIENGNCCLHASHEAISEMIFL